MAAKQGLSAHFSQASEDAKRAVLSHTPLKSSWFSNLNTTCTIKSAPPRTPEVLSLLSTKSGWLWKRNEQHVWQARWCCVVPHTFLYYFDNIHAGGENGTAPPVLTAAQQERLNQAVKSGYGDKPHAGPRSSFNVFSPSAAATAVDANGDSSHHGTTTDHNNNTAAATNAASSLLDKSPAGIIDLECYSSVHRSDKDELLLELAGDDSVNPDLRSFYFLCSCQNESDDWTSALLNNRHSHISDELHAFREVAQGFSLQLQELHSELDILSQQKQDYQDECYSVRSAAEEVRRTGFRLVREALERDFLQHVLQDARKAFRDDLESVREMGLVPAIQLLTEYVRVVETKCMETYAQSQELQQQLRQFTEQDQSLKKELQIQLQQKQDDFLKEKAALEQEVQLLTTSLEHSQKMHQDALQDLASQRMEMTMLQNSTRQSMSELHQHKRILKREVLSLRQQLDDVTGELSLLKHQSQSCAATAEQERAKSQLLEKYVERMESQVKVQQSMMEFMSQSGGSIAGASGRMMISGNGTYSRNYADTTPEQQYYHTESTATSPRNNMFQNETLEHNQLMRRAQEIMEVQAKNVVLETDEKSHMSELTEDRTQRHFEYMDPETNSAKRPPKRLPSYIGVHDDDHDDDLQENCGTARGMDTISMSTAEHQHKLETIMSASLPPTTKSSGSSVRRDSVPRMSVAQRARLEGGSTPVRVRVPPPPPQKHVRTNSSGFLSSFGKSLTEAIDNTVLGVPEPDTSDDSRSYSSSGGEEQDRGGIARSDTGISEVSVGTSMSLQDRQAMQRAKQLAFLKEQGLIKEESNLVGGAGAPSPTHQRSSSSLNGSQHGGGGGVRR